jgi:hypothetical protein
VRALVAAVVVTAMVLGGAPPARAQDDTSAEFKSVGLAVAYVVPVGCSAIGAVVNGAYMGVGEGAPMYLRATAVGCGIVAAGVGTYMLIDDHSSGGKIALGLVPIIIGGLAITLGLIVGPPRDLVGNMNSALPVTPLVFDDGGLGLGYTTTF